MLWRLGGRIGELVKAAGLRSPFEEGCLTDVVAQAREKLLD